MITRQLHKELMYIAGNLPAVVTNTHEKQIIDAEEYFEMFEKQPAKEDIIPKGPHKGKVMIEYPVQVASNHYRRLRRAYIKNGQPGVIAYIKNGQPGVIAYIKKVKALEHVQ